jgi:hypothetical protein
MKKLINRFAKWLMAKTCDHKEKWHIHTDYVDRYIKDKCIDCGTEIYTDL